MSDNSKVAKPQWPLFFILSYLLILGYIYFVNPSKDKAAEQAALDANNQTTGTLTSPAGREADSPTTSPVVFADPTSSATIEQHPGELVNLRTNIHNIELDSVGGVVNSWRLMHTGSQSFDPAENTSGVEMVQKIPSLNPDELAPQNWPLEVTFIEQGSKSYEDFNLTEWESEVIDVDGQKALRMKSQPIRGLRVEKTLSIPDGEYYGKFQVTVFNENDSSIPITDEFGRGLTLRWGPGLVARDPANPDASANTYDAAVVRDFEEVQVFRPKIDEEAQHVDGILQWAGVESKFFAALLVPYQSKSVSERKPFFFRTLVPNNYKLNPEEAATIKRQTELENYKAPLVMELSTAKFDIPAKGSQTFEYGIYVGPKKHSILKKYDQDLESLMYSESFSWMRAIYLVLTDLLNWIHRVLVSNYGIAIIVLTVIVKLLVFPLVHRSIKIQGKSSAEMKRVKPHLEAINEKYKEDPQEKQRQTWKVYQEHGINPLGAMRSCLPVLPQIPIFIGLYRIANDTIDLQGAHFLWIKDLSQSDHFFHFGSHVPLIGSYLNLLPFLVAITQIFSSKISMSRSIQNITDENQKQMQKMMIYLIPVMVLVTMYHFPSGLMLYWIASNTWQIGQTLITNKILDREEEKHLKAGPPPRKPKKAANPNSFMGKLMAKAEEARKEMERREAAAKKTGTSQVGGNRKKR